MAVNEPNRYFSCYCACNLSIHTQITKFLRAGRLLSIISVTYDESDNDRSFTGSMVELKYDCVKNLKVGLFSI